MLGERFLTVNFLVRKWQIEYTRHSHNGVSEESYNTPENIAKISRWVREAFPEGQVTWALSWEALFDPGPHWQGVRETLADCYGRFGDQVTINPGGGFPNVYNTKEQINRDLEDAFEAIERWLGKPPRNIVSWQLSAANIAHAARRFGVVATSGHCWSQHGVDNLSQEGSIMYPYYPSLLNALRPAQSAEDQINCVMLDTVTTDLVTARFLLEEEGQDCRMGVQPIETVMRFGYEVGLRQMKLTADRYLRDNYTNLPFVWITNQLEPSVIFFDDDCARATRDWLAYLAETYPDLKLLSTDRFADRFMQTFPDNESLNYNFRYRGTGISGSDPAEEMLWWMNKDYRLGVLRSGGGCRVIDYVSYKDAPPEPEGPQSNWSLPAILSQKQEGRRSKAQR